MKKKNITTTVRQQRHEASLLTEPERSYANEFLDVLEEKYGLDTPYTMSVLVKKERKS